MIAQILHSQQSLIVRRLVKKRVARNIRPSVEEVDMLP